MDDPAEWVCPLPLRDYPSVVLGHGGGGLLSAELIEHIFLPAFGNPALDALGDAAVLTPPPGRLAFTTDSFVVRPLFFPGGSIGDLAVNGSVNDLAMRGARPLWLSAGFILEEGLPLRSLGAIVARMASAARAAGVQIVTGDTKVVERGHGDGLYINTAGIGVVPPGIEIGPDRARPGDIILVSGTIGDHGMAVMSVREGLEFDSPIESDCRPLAGLVQALLDRVPGAVRVLRDPTRGGVAAVLHEIAAKSGVGIDLSEPAVPVSEPVRSACELLGLDPLHVANEGKLVAIVARERAEEALAVLREHPAGGPAAAIIAVVTDQHPGRLVARTAIGASRVIAPALGEQLPRIC